MKLTPTRPPEASGVQAAGPRMLLVGLLLVGSGVIAGVLVGSRGGSTELAAVPESTGESAPAFVRQGFGTHAVQGGGNGSAAQLRQRLDALAARVAADAAERHGLQQRLDALAAQLAALRPGSPGNDSAPAAGQVTGGRVSPPTRDNAAPSQAAAPAAPGAEPTAGGVSTVEHALLAAGIDSTTAAEIKHRQDSLTLEEVYLRDQASREGWLNTPRFNDEMAKVQSQRVSMRDEIGDDAYDLYLSALGQPNRVRVEDVLHDSPAAQAGVQAGDVVLRYGDTRLLTTEDLISATHGGTLGDTVHLEIMRNGQPITIDVPRGPLGLSVASVAQATNK